MRSPRTIVALAVVAALFLASVFATNLVVDFLWFSSVGYRSVFQHILLARVAIFLAVFAASGLAIGLSGMLALRFSRSRPAWITAIFDQGTPGAQSLTDRLQQAVTTALWRRLVLAAAAALALLVAAGESANWGTVLRFIDQVAYGEPDPLFGKDIGFYLFSLPAYIALSHWLMTTLVLSALLAAAVYVLRGDVAPVASRPFHVSPAAIAHGSVLLGLFFAVKAYAYYLDRYQLLYDDNGVVIGAGYTDVHVELPILWMMIGFTVAAAVASCVNAWWRTRWLPTVGVAGFFALVAIAVVVPPVVERVYVKPSELERETPYLRRNILLTQEAYGLRDVTVKPFPAEENLTFNALEADRGTTDNIRLWDWRPLMDTYAQLQEIRTYYKFYDVDVDRYEIGNSYQQVMLSARQLDSSLLPANAQTWVNLHLLFTHGDGVVMSPVTRKTPEGLPIFYEQDVPPVASGGPAITQPRIYFGEGTYPYVIVKTGTQEFDYPKGSENVYSTYDGSGGVPLGSLFRRSLFAWYFDDPNILISGYIKDDSRVMFRRNIGERIGAIAPFLHLDSDPYIVVADGRLYWIEDAYTTSTWFPYSEPAPSGLNYIRNSVKVVVDAYDGTVDFYIADPHDPVLATYRRIFPALFKPLDAMPEALQRHIRYPEDLFQLQASMYRTYHMTAPEVFYNREDLWQFPRQTSSVGGLEANTGAAMGPYYTIMRLPGATQNEFFLMLPMVPNRRENMIALLAGGCDPPDYGKLIVYEFPKEKLIYGPFQIEARINQNTAISQQISLWNQMGSRVIRGDVLVIPIENSLIYVSPLYLRAAQGQLPELKRVIAAYGDRVVMTETLPEALQSLFTGAPAPAASEAVPSAAAAPATAPANAAKAALDAYDRAIERLKAGDWSGFGAALDELKPLLQSLSQEQNAR